MTATGETYGQQFRRLRLQLGMTLREAATASGVSIAAVTAWESDQRHFNSPEQSARIRRAIAILKRKALWREKGR